MRVADPQGGRKVWAQLLFPNSRKEFEGAAFRLAREMNPNQAGWAASFRALQSAGLGANRLVRFNREAHRMPTKPVKA